MEEGIITEEHIAKLKELMELNLELERQKAEKRRKRNREEYKRWKLRKKRNLMKEIKNSGKN